MNHLLILNPQLILCIQFLFVVLILMPAMGLLSVSRNNFEGNKRLLWIAIIILLPIVGSILYVFIGRRQRLRKAF